MFQVQRDTRALVILAFFICFALSICRSASALPSGWQLSQCRQDSWGVREGLPAYEINAIAQTPDGYLWLATQGGLVRFDGMYFDTFTVKNLPGLKSNMVTALATDKAGRLWLGADWGGFGYLDHGRFHYVGGDTSHWNRTQSLFEAADGSVWAGVREYTSTLYHVADGKLIATYEGPDVAVSIAESPSGEIDCSLQTYGVYRLPKKGRILERIPIPGLPVPISSLVYTNDGALWCGTGHKGIYRLRRGRASVSSAKSNLQSDMVSALLKDREGRLWLGSTNGLAVYGNGMGGFGRSGFQACSRPGDSFDPDITALFEDREGNLWIGSRKGLCRAASTQLVPYTLFSGTILSTMLLTDAVCPAKAGGVWCATDTGLWRIRPFQTVHVRIDDPLLNAHVDAISEAPDGTLWGVSRSDLRSEVVFHLQAPSGAPGPSGGIAHVLRRYALPTTINVYHLVPDRDGVTLFGQNTGDPNGSIGAKLTSGYRILTQGRLTPFSLSTGYTFCIKREPSGAFWIAYEHGLMRFSHGAVRKIDFGLPPGAHVLSIDITNLRDIWLGTDKGLVRLRNGKPILYGSRAGLTDADSFQVLNDGRGRIWMGGGTGITSVRIRDCDAYDRGEIKNIPLRTYESADGVQSYPTLFCAARDSQGALWFAGPKGLTYVDPSRPYVAPEAPVVVEEAVLDGHKLALGRLTKIAPGRGALQVRYAALTYAAPERVKFRYKLEGFDTVWTDARGSRLASYTNLPPGRYKFLVAACKDDGNWEAAVSGFSFELKPHFYQTLWFRLLCTAAVVSLLLCGYRVRVRAIVRHTQYLEQVVAERTAELVQSNEDLQDMQAELEAQNDELGQTRDALSEANLQLMGLATTDGLTGLKNHRAFQEHLEQEWTRRERRDSNLSIILLDVDKFKQYNDTYGHPGGDQVLKQVARLLTAHVRETDLVARYGGEEFIVIAPDTDEAGALQLAERIRSAIEGAEWPDRAVTASFGVSTTPPALTSAADLVAHADAALYRSKNAGRNRVTHYAADLCQAA